MSDRVDIIVKIEGGLVQEVVIPEHLSHVVVVVNDYDTEGAEDDDLVTDDKGKEHWSTDWEYEENV